MYSSSDFSASLVSLCLVTGIVLAVASDSKKVLMILSYMVFLSLGLAPRSPISSRDLKNVTKTSYHRSYQ